MKGKYETDFTPLALALIAFLVGAAAACLELLI